MIVPYVAVTVAVVIALAELYESVTVVPGDATLVAESESALLVSPEIESAIGFGYAPGGTIVCIGIQRDDAEWNRMY